MISKNLDKTYQVSLVLPYDICKKPYGLWKMFMLCWFAHKTNKYSWNFINKRSGYCNVIWNWRHYMVSMASYGNDQIIKGRFFNSSSWNTTQIFCNDTFQQNGQCLLNDTLGMSYLVLYDQHLLYFFVLLTICTFYFLRNAILGCI